MDETITKYSLSPSGEKLLSPVRRIVLVLNLMGLWPKKSLHPDDPKQNMCTTLLYAFYTIIFQSIFTFAYVGFKCFNFLFITDLTILTRAMFIVLTELSLTVKIINFYARMSSMQKCLTTVGSIKLFNTDEEIIFQKHLTLLQNILIAFLVTANTTGVFSYLSPVLVDGVELPYPGWYPFDWKHNSRDYWIVFVYQVLGMFSQIQALVLIEVFFIYLMVVVSGQLDVLANRIEAIGYADGELAESEGEWNLEANLLAEHKLKDCIKIHKQVLDLTNVIETAGSIPYFIQFLLSGIILCVAVFQIGIMNIRESIAEFGFYFGFVMTMLTQIFLPCYFGNEVQLKSQQLYGSLYRSNWPSRSQRYQKLVMVYMEMLKRPRKLVVGQLFSLNLDSFLSVLNKAYSLYAVLQSFNE